MAKRLTVFKRGNAYYVRGKVVVGDKSQSVYESTGLLDEQAANIYATRLENRLTDELLIGKKHLATFQEAMVLYGESGGSPRYMAAVAAAFGKRKLRDIGQSDLDAAARRAYPTATSETRNRQFYTPFIAVWNHAVLNEMAELRKWRRPRAQKGTNAVRPAKPRAGSTPTKYDRAAAFIASMSPDAAMLTTFLFYTGMRPAEAFALLAEDVDLAARWLVVRNSKTGEPRGVPIHDFLAEWLGDLIDRGGSLFRTSKGKAYKPVGFEEDKTGGGMKSAIRGARRRSGVADISPYSARHTVSTQLVINGVHPHIKDQILGHAADDMSRHYTNVPQGPLIEAINTLPVPDGLRALPWVESPKIWFGRLAEGTGKRTDLAKRA